MLDLGLVVADKNMDFTLRGILARPEALGIRKIAYQIVVHPGHDGGVRTAGPETLATLQGKTNHGIVMLDLEGSGAEGDDYSVEAELDERLRAKWGHRAKAIVIKPELDAWVWGSDNAIRQVLDCSIIDIRGWLQSQGFEFSSDRKPARPKEAFQYLMDELKEPRSSANYKSITSKISLERCTDPAFLRFRTTLQSWFRQV